MKASSKKRILRMVVLDLLGFCVLAYLVCAQVFHFFPWKPIEIDMTEINTASMNAADIHTPVPTDTPAPIPAPTDTPAPTDAPDGTADPNAETPAPTNTPEPTPEPTLEPTPEPSGLLKGKFAEKFSPDQVISTDTEYRSEDITIELNQVDAYYCRNCAHISKTFPDCEYCGTELRKVDYVPFTLADIYIQDINCFRTFVAPNASKTELVRDMCKEQNGILGINTDYCLNAYGNKHGWFVRNGVKIARFNKISSDLAILYPDGVMETIDISSETYSPEEIEAASPFQVWYFGPALLTRDGQAKTKFTIGKMGNLADPNPRSAIGYYEPGHYCFIAVNGRGKLRGISLAELSQLCADLGMAAAYNMDGGQSSALYFNGKTYGNNGRTTSDIAYIAEVNK